MKTIELSGQLREKTGSNLAAAARREGAVPCVIYGSTQETVHFTAMVADMKPFIYSPFVFFVNIKLGDKTYKTVMKDIQFHPVTDHPLHLDFLQVADDKPIRVDLPVTIKGTAPGVREGGRLVLSLRRLKALAMAAKMPGEVVLDVSSMNIGDKIRIADINIDGVEFLEAPNIVVVAVKVTRVVVPEASAVPVAGAEGAAPAAAEAGKEEGKDDKKKDDKKKDDKK
jgi:large subunit ribosomal protein L25